MQETVFQTIYLHRLFQPLMTGNQLVPPGSGKSLRVGELVGGRESSGVGMPVGEMGEAVMVRGFGREGGGGMVCAAQAHMP